jgi:hypothetical protein
LAATCATLFCVGTVRALTPTPTLTPSNCSIAFYGHVTEGVTQAPLADAQVCLSAGNQCVQTDASGFYDQLCYQGQSSAGSRVCATAAGYEENCQGPWTPAGQTELVDFVLNPAPPSSDTPTATPTATPTNTPTATPTSCYGSLPVVKPVPAQTDQQQLVVYFCGRIAGSSSMSACSEAGCAPDVSFGFGDPNCTVSCLATCNKGTVPLLPGQTNHITVCQQNGSCGAGGCVTTDLNGAPLIVEVATPSATPTETPTASATPTITVTPTPTSCYGSLPVVKPVPAQTDRQQLVVYFCGRIAGASSMSACSEAGCAPDVSFGGGDPNCTVSCLATCNKGTVPLLPGQTNHITVCQQNGSCSAGGCVTTDVDGAPLVVQVATPTPTPTASATPTDTPTPTPTSCYGSLPVVKPVPAQTDQPQLVVYFCGRIAGSSSMSACSEAGCAPDVSFGGGDPNCTVSCPATCNNGTVPLLPGQTNHITVCQFNGSCSAGGCVTTDLEGAPLVVQVATPADTPTPTPTATATPTMTVTPTPTSCYGGLPVVKPVPAQTDQQQLVVYFCGRIAGASSMSACSEAGCAPDVSFGGDDPNCTVSCPATCNKGTVPLLPDQTNHITVCQFNGSCSAGGCVTTDFDGAPLIVQVGTPSGTSTPTPSASATPTITATPTTSVSPTITPTPTAAPCTGDCDGDGVVRIDEIVTVVNVAVGSVPPSACPHGLPTGATVDVSLIIEAVDHALNGCTTAD